MKNRIELRGQLTVKAVIGTILFFVSLAHTMGVFWAIALVVGSILILWDAK